MIDFNFQYIKNKATPGVWRRGYDYYQKKQVESINLTESGIIGKVKGNFRDEYTTSLIFSNDNVKAECDCPFPDEWCKHAVAVGLIGISDGLWNKYWGIEDKQKNIKKDFKGSYKFLFNDKSKPKTVSIKVIERSTGNIITQIEPILRTVVETQKQNLLHLNEEQLIEFKFLTFLHKNGQIDKQRQHYYINYEKLSELIAFLNDLEDILHSENNQEIVIETNPLKLILNINISIIGNVLVALHWKRSNPEDIIPYEEIKLFAKRIQWGLYKNIIFPIETKVGELPYFLSKSSFLDIKGSDGGKFLFEQLPKFKNSLEGEMVIEESDLVQNARLEQKKPKKVLTLETPDESSVRVALEFEYDGIRVPYTETVKEHPYVCIVKGTPIQKQYSVEEFREQEAAKRRADIESGEIDPQKEEKKLKKVIRIKVVNKDKSTIKPDTIVETNPAEENLSENNITNTNEVEHKQLITPDNLIDTKETIEDITKQPESSIKDLNNIDNLPINQILTKDKILKKTSKAKKNELYKEEDLLNKIFIGSPDYLNPVLNEKNPNHLPDINTEPTEKELKKTKTTKSKKDKTNKIKKIDKEIDFIEENIPINDENTEQTEIDTQIITKPEDIYWIKRDIDTENEAYKRLLSCRLTPMQTNKLSAKNDDTIDFIGIHFKKFLDDENWIVEYPEEIERIRIADEPLKFNIYIDFAGSKQSFILKICSRVGKREMGYEETLEIAQKGRKYIYIQGAGFAEIPIAEMLQLSKILTCFDANKIQDSIYRVLTYKVGLIGELYDLNLEISMSEDFKKFWDVILSFSNTETLDIPSKIKAELREYQKCGFSWLYFLYTYGLNGILADDMGLGKTLQTLSVLQKIKEDFGNKPSLVVCPTSVVFNWEDEIQKFTPELKLLKYTGATRHELTNRILSSDIVITSYSLLWRDISKLKRYDFRYIILDESQKIKNYQSLTASVSKQLRSSHRLALSGTPIENRLSELWSVFDFLMPDFLYDYKEFRSRYAQPIEEFNNKDAEKRLKKQVYPFILRRLKQDVAKDLPDKLEFMSYCDLLPEQQEIYIDILNKTKDELFKKVEKDGIAKSQMSILTALLRLRQICCHPKLIGDIHESTIRNSGKFENLKEMILEVIEQKHRILLFSQFVEMLKLIRDWLEKEGIKFEYLTGSTTNRKECVDRFNNDETIPIFLISLKAGGTGLNLTGADYVIHYDPWWNPAVEDQATDRAHRIGQTKKVFVYKLITKGTVEEKIIKLQHKKRDLIDSVITVDTSLGKILTYEDLKDIFSADF